MKRRPPLPLLLALPVLLAGIVYVGAQGGSAGSPPHAPKGFLGIDPQEALSDEDAAFMKAAGIQTVRVPLIWAAVQPTEEASYDWTGFDEAVAVAARHGLRVLPFVVGTPPWIAPSQATLPIDSASARRAWSDFLAAAVKRYGPDGEFWAEQSAAAAGESAVATLPIRSWQIWNEPNFFYFAYPASPQRYAKLLQISTPAIKGADPGAQVILGGLFGRPTAGGARGVPAAKFLENLYRTPGIKSEFDGIALHPYAVDTERLEEIVEEVHEVTVENRDRVPLYITEIGWGSQDDPRQVAFEQGSQGQVGELESALAYLIEDRRELDLAQVFWFAWKDLPGSCNFCDSAGLFQTGAPLRPKPSWHAFVAISGGRARP